MVGKTSPEWGVSNTKNFKALDLNTDMSPNILRDTSLDTTAYTNVIGRIKAEACCQFVCQEFKNNKKKIDTNLAMTDNHVVVVSQFFTIMKDVVLIEHENVDNFNFQFSIALDIAQISYD